MTITRRQALAGALGAPYLQIAKRRARRRTNVVFFMTDDHGAWALGSYGCQDLHTPVLDRLAGEGARFTRAYACTPVCSPSRMTYMTGRIPSTHGVQDWLVPVDSYGPRTHAFLDGHPTFTEILAKEGYALGLSGKWHMGDDEHPQRGFIYWCTVPGGGGPYRDPEFVKNGGRLKYDGYKTDAVGDFALEFLDQYKSRPFFLYVPFYAPHTPYNYQPEKYRQWYNQSKFPCFPDTPMHPWQNKGLKEHHGNRASKHAYSALISGVDANVGRILTRLGELGLREQTLVVFTADQGWNAGHHGVWGKGNGTWPFNLYEESLRVPLIWNQPGRIRPGQALNPLVSAYDFFPTILDYLGVAAPKDPKRVGHSYAGFVRGQPPARWANRLYFEYAHVRGLRTDNLKYVERTQEWPSELFDLEADPGETRNVIDEAAYQGQLKAFRAELAGFFRQAGAPPLEEWRTTTKQELTVYSR
jgi:choline-sulfatase